MADPVYDPRRIFDEPLMMPIAAVVRELVATLERGPVALLAGVKSAREVSAWAASDTTPRPDRIHTLRSALQASRLIVDLEGIDSARAWFMGTNPHFNFRAPAQVLRDGDEDARTLVVRAAQDFVKDAMAHAKRVEYVGAVLAN